MTLSGPEAEEDMEDENEAGVGAWFVKAEAKELYGKLRERWDKLFAWGVGDKLPNVRLQIEAWRSFAAAWEASDEQPEALNAFEAELNTVELYAKDTG